MSDNVYRRLLPAYVLLVGSMVLLLHIQGRIWWCACGRLNLWAGEMWSSHTSQHLFDQYSFSHLLHGVIFFWLLRWLAPRMRMRWRLWLAVLIESLWELLENSPLIIQRYREATIDQGYAGDSIFNSLGDLLSCAMGYVIASRISLRKAIALYIIVELVLLFWIRDNLTLNVIMLLHPIEAIKQWQISG